MASNQVPWCTVSIMCRAVGWLARRRSRKLVSGVEGCHCRSLLFAACFTSPVNHAAVHVHSQSSRPLVVAYVLSSSIRCVWPLLPSWVQDVAFVTLCTNDRYSHGALVLAHSLRLTNTRARLVCMVAPPLGATARYCVLLTAWPTVPCLLRSPGSHLTVS